MNKQKIVTTLNFFDYVPLISSFAGIIRILIGLCLTLLGTLFLPYQIYRRIQKGKSLLSVMLGLATVVRGVIAAKPLIGNAVLYMYDRSKVWKPDIRKTAGLEL
jgi:hypothetical protein